MIWALVCLASLASVELLHRLPVIDRVRRASIAAQKSARVISSKAISDHWKERALPRYSMRIGVDSVASFFFLILALSPLLLLAAAGPLIGRDIVALLLDWRVIIGISAGAIAYSMLRSRLLGSRTQAGNESGYSPSAKMMHRFTLASPSRGEMLFDIESATVKSLPAGAEAGRHVFVTGLARAGTTALMRALHESGAFASLTYRDMPFVMAPNLWARLSGRSRKHMDKTERAHGDGVLVDFDSPEALEEPFWRTFCQEDYIGPDALTPHTPDGDIIENYRRFVGHVLARHGAARYLAKNNNSVLRLPALAKAFPEATILAPFREPLAQARSLQAQHRRFMAEKDPFTRDYMAWLAHHEFGPGHRPFAIGGEQPLGDPGAIGYWLHLWIIVHAHLLAQAKSGALGSHLVPLAYEDFCAPDHAAWRALCDLVGIPPGDPGFRLAEPPTDAADTPGRITEARAIYDELQSLSRQRLPGWSADREEMRIEA